MKNRKRKISLVLLILIACITLGYAAIRTGLNINGVVDIPNVSWDVYFSNYQNSASTNIIPTTEPSIPAGEKPTTISYVVDLTEPGDIYEFTVDVVNDGTIDAMIESISSKLNDVEIDSEHPVPSYLNYKITYADDVAIKPNHALAHNTHETYKVRIEFREDIDPEDLPVTSEQLRLDLTVVYERDDGTGIDPRPISDCTSDYCYLFGVMNRKIESYDISENCVTNITKLGYVGANATALCNGEKVDNQSLDDFVKGETSEVLVMSGIIDNVVYSANTDGAVNDWRDLKKSNNEQREAFIKFKSDLSKVYVCNNYNVLDVEPTCAEYISPYDDESDVNQKLNYVANAFGDSNKTNGICGINGTFSQCSLGSSDGPCCKIIDGDEERAVIFLSFAVYSYKIKNDSADICMFLSSGNAQCFEQ